MAQIRNPSSIKSNMLFKGIYDIKFNFKDKNYLEIKEGDVIYSKGDKSEYMYLVLEGRVKFKVYENPRQPKVYLVGRNEFFGEKELVDKAHRNSSALAERDTLLYRLSYKDFFKLTSEYRKILSNLSEKKYEEVVPPTRKAELKADIFSRIINEGEKPARKGTGIELKDYSYENPLLELKAQDEITEELKIYQEESDEDNNTDDLIVDDADIRWELNDEEENIEVSEEEQNNEISDGISEEEDLIPGDEKAIDFKIPEIPGESEESSEDIIEKFKKIQDQVNIFRDSLNETPEPEAEEVSSGEISTPQKFALDDSFIKAVEKLSSSLTEEEAVKSIVEACVELVNAERGIVYFPDLNSVLKGRLIEDDIEVVAGTDSIPGRCLRESGIINIKDVFNDPNFNPSVDYVSYFHIHSLICIPIPDENKIKAVVQLFNSREGEFSTEQEETLKSLTSVILKTLERSEKYSREINNRENKITEAETKISELVKEAETKISELAKIEIQQPPPKEEISDEKKSVPLGIVSDFLFREFNIIVEDVKQFNSYLQRIDIPGETKEVADIVTSQTTKMLDVVEALKLYAGKEYFMQMYKDSYVSVFNDMVSLLAEYTENRKVNLYKRFGTDLFIKADSRFLYLAVFQLIKYQCEMMPGGGNIFISSENTNGSVEILIRNVAAKTGETPEVIPEFKFDEESAAGLGLSLAKRIIENHNAELTIKNQTGSGVEISIRFPVSI